MLISRVARSPTPKFIMEINAVKQSIADLTERVTALRGYL
jgi:hypothetical protein